MPVDSESLNSSLISYSTGKEKGMEPDGYKTFKFLLSNVFGIT